MILLSHSQYGIQYSTVLSRLYPVHMRPRREILGLLFTVGIYCRVLYSTAYIYPRLGVWGRQCPLHQTRRAPSSGAVGHTWGGTPTQGSVLQGPIRGPLQERAAGAWAESHGRVFVLILGVALLVVGYTAGVSQAGPAESRRGREE